MDEHKPEQEDPWREVGEQFSQLGQGIRDAWQAWKKTEPAKEVQTNLEAMVDQIGSSLRKAVESPQGQRIQEDATRTVESIRSAGKQTSEEVRPQIISALKKLNQELGDFISRLEEEPGKKE